MIATTNLRELLDGIDPLCQERLRIEFKAASRRAQKPRLRSRVEFALQEIICPEGPHKGERLREEFQPLAIDLLRRMDETELRRFAVSGCVQSGKTLIVIVVNLLWHLFERGHTVIYGVPELKMAKKKWEKEILPVIRANPKFRRMLPDSGSGSKGGFDGTIEFKNGATLEFMGATGNDSRRSSSTAQVLFKTEVDRFDEANDGSREASPAETMEDRVAAYEDSAYIYEECTKTITSGRINVQVNGGLYYTLKSDCPHCGEYVHPGREHLVGFEDAESAPEARELGTFICPNCAAIITEEERQAMQDRLVSVSRTQTVAIGSDGSALIEGELPKTRVFSYEWDGFFNRFWTTAYLAEAEWKSITDQDGEDGERQAKQKRWAIAVDPADYDIDPLTSQDIYQRHTGFDRGFAPPDAVRVTAGVDVRKTQLHYVIVAWRANGSGHVVDYGVWDVPWKEHGVEEAVPLAVVEMTMRRFAKGVPVAVEEGQPAKRLPIGYKLYDFGWQTERMREAMRRIAGKKVTRARGIFGRGQSEPPGAGSYSHPKAASKSKPWVGRDCYLTLREDTREYEVFANSDEWKSFVRRGLSPEIPSDAPGSLTLWQPQSSDEKKFAREFGKQIRAETQKMKNVARRGEVIVWEKDNYAANHFGDALYYACVASQLEGVKIAKQPSKRGKPLQEQVATTPVVTA